MLDTGTTTTSRTSAAAPLEQQIRLLVGLRGWQASLSFEGKRWQCEQEMSAVTPSTHRHVSCLKAALPQSLPPPCSAVCSTPPPGLSVCNHQLSYNKPSVRWLFTSEIPDHLIAAFLCPCVCSLFSVRPFSSPLHPWSGFQDPNPCKDDAEVEKLRLRCLRCHDLHTPL